MDINELKTLLLESNIDLKKWSHTLGKKTIEELNKELENGESTLEIIDNKLVRVVKIASIQVQVKLGDKIFNLVEDKQIFFTGAVRKRGLKSLSEKTKKNETPEITAQRALREEIGLEINKGLIFEEETQKIQKSPSYPGLDSIYKIFNYQITLNHQQLEQIRFSEYQKKKGKITLFSLESSKVS